MCLCFYLIVMEEKKPPTGIDSTRNCATVRTSVGRYVHTYVHYAIDAGFVHRL